MPPWLGDLVRVCLGFTNTTNEAITITIPKGLIIISTDDKTQNGLVIKVETIEIPANAAVSGHCRTTQTTTDRTLKNDKIHFSNNNFILPYFGIWTKQASDNNYKLKANDIRKNGKY